MEKKGLIMEMVHLQVFILLLLSSSCQSDDQLTQAKPLSPGGMLVSKDGVFALGFFSPTTNTNESLYIGIWYHNIPDRTLVWVANRDSPITTTTPSAAKLAITDNQELALSNSTTGRPLWATATGGAGVVAVLLSSGNFVLQSANGTVMWQSFDHPTDTILPTMRVLFSYQGHVVTRLFASKGPADPSTGDFSLSMDPITNLQIFVWNGTRLYYRINFLLDVAAFGGGGSYGTSVITSVTRVNGDELYFVYRVSDDSPIYTRLSLDYTGKLRLLTWNNNTSSWTAGFERPRSGCDIYAVCGPFGYCDNTESVPSCRCLNGFEPIDGLDVSRGCRRNEALVCGMEYSFVTLPAMKVPKGFMHVENTSFDQCLAECSTNCSCTAFAYVNISTAGTLDYTSRCLVWTGDLVDAGKFPSFGQDLYVRLAVSHVHKKTNLAKILLPVTAFVLLIAFTALALTYKYRGTRRKKKVQKRQMLEYLRSTDEAGDKNLEFPFIDFKDIAVATNNFSDTNMLGKGGFGKVYKGMMDGTNEVAIKRLSKSSGQGTEEFRNEVVLIAKLQHKNLVRLLGCCIHEDEKLLVYEYMSNKSLDYFIFDTARRSMLQWPARFKIIKGIARGIMYLHQDSRLTIIHRDLKASNILLDAEMIPKISDFGMARILSSGDQHHANTNRVVGTYGYMSPEYAMEGAFSVKSDTYSFGVLLLEIVTGIKISSPNLLMDFPNLIVQAWNLWKDDNIEDLVDSYVKENCPLDEVSRCIRIGLLCVQDSPNCRPLMSAVVFMLENKTTPLPIPTQPVYFARRDAKPERADNNRVSSVNDMSLTALEGR